MTPRPAADTREHQPVMAQDVIEGMAVQNGKTYVDATFGRGGYSELMLGFDRTRVIGIDRDPDAVAAGRTFEKRFGARFTMVPGAFGDMAALLRDIDINGVDGIAFDLGVSSPQLDTAERGFSFRLDGPLDMRMGDHGPTAADIVNDTDETKLAHILYTYGEERASRRIAKAIVARRKTEKFSRTVELADLVESVLPRQKGPGGDTHPATRTFQALRIAVNDELGELERGLVAAEAILNHDGYLAVVTFHSLEDRIVKNFLREKAGRMPAGSRHRPAAAKGPAPTFRLVSVKAILPSAAEVKHNPRARSAKLRLAVRIRDKVPHAA
jgi:16S rRNA (cytosine1402-N4)-methyltransferase